MKKILILGARKAQIQLLAAAKDLGYFTIVIGLNPLPEILQLTDKCYTHDFLDKDFVTKISEDEKIDGVISNTEIAMKMVSHIVDTYHLPGNSLESVENLMSKVRFRDLQRKCGVFAPSNAVVENETELLNVASKIQYPILVKPALSIGGTHGITKIQNYDEDEILKAFNNCRSASLNQQVSLEEYVEMNGLEVIEGDVFVLGKEIFWNGLFTNKRSKYLPLVPMTDIAPIKVSSEDFTLLKDTLTKIFVTAGISLGEFNVEAFITKSHQIFVIEINVRQGGGGLPECILHHSGIDFTKLLVSTSVGDLDYYKKVALIEKQYNYIVYHDVFPRTNGFYKGLHIDKEIEKYVYDIEEVIKTNTDIKIENNYGDCLAIVKMKFDNRENQQYYTDNIEDYIYPEMEN